MDEGERGKQRSLFKIQHSKKLRSWHPVPSLHGKCGKKWKIKSGLFISWAPKSLQMVTAAMKVRRLLVGIIDMANLDSVLKSRNITL